MEWLKSEKAVKCIGVLLLLVLIGTVFCLNPEFFMKLWSIMLSGDIQKTVDYIKSFGSWAVIFAFLLCVIINALGFLPAIFFSTANAVVFGLFEGIILSWIAETIGVMLSFLLMRSVLRSSAEKLIAKSKYLIKVDEFSGSKGFKVMLFARIIPYFPSGIITALGDVSKIGLRDYFFANLIGKFPSTALEAAIGYDLVNAGHSSGPVKILIGALVAIYMVVWFYKRRKNKLAAEKNNEFKKTY